MYDIISYYNAGMRTPTNTLLVAMAVSDTMTGMSAIPVYLYFYLGMSEYLPVLLPVGRLSRLGAVSLVLPLLLPQRAPADHLPHGVRLADCFTRYTEVIGLMHASLSSLVSSLSAAAVAVVSPVSIQKQSLAFVA